MTPPKSSLANSEFIGVAYMTGGEGLCGGLNNNGPHRLIYFNICSILG